jgi:6-phosphogluconolactonase (cycloisomerase 2 family)
MKFSKSSQLFLVSSIGLLVATLLAACSVATVDYVFVTSAPATVNGQIYTFDADSESGALRTGPAAVSSGGVDPVAMAVTSDYANLYVANKTSGTVVHFTIGSNGVLTQQSDTITNITASVALVAPVALAVNSAGTYLYVVSGTTSATLSEYALSSGTISTPTKATATQTLTLSGYASDTMVPTGITVLANTSTVSGDGVYVTAYDQSAYNPGCTPQSTCITSSANPGWVFGFTVGTAGALTATANSPYEAGVMPSGIASSPTDLYLYVTDYAKNELIGYSILSSSTLNLLGGSDSTTATGNEPSAVAIDPRGLFIYVSNAGDNTVSAYAITLATGAPTVVVNSSSKTDTRPVAIAVDPALGRFVFTANYLGSSLSGFRLNPTSGALTATQATPYPTPDPTALVIAPHGNHATESVSP